MNLELAKQELSKTDLNTKLLQQWGAAMPGMAEMTQDFINSTQKLKLTIDPDMIARGAAGATMVDGVQQLELRLRSFPTPDEEIPLDALLTISEEYTHLLHYMLNPGLLQYIAEMDVIVDRLEALQKLRFPKYAGLVGDQLEKDVHSQLGTFCQRAGLEPKMPDPKELLTFALSDAALEQKLLTPGLLLDIYISLTTVESIANKFRHPDLEAIFAGMLDDNGQLTENAHSDFSKARSLLLEHLKTLELTETEIASLNNTLALSTLLPAYEENKLKVEISALSNQKLARAVIHMLANDPLQWTQQNLGYLLNNLGLRDTTEVTEEQLLATLNNSSSARQECLNTLLNIVTCYAQRGIALARIHNLQGTNMQDYKFNVAFSVEAESRHLDAIMNTDLAYSAGYNARVFSLEKSKVAKPISSGVLWGSAAMTAELANTVSSIVSPIGPKLEEVIGSYNRITDQLWQEGQIPIDEIDDHIKEQSGAFLDAEAKVANFRHFVDPLAEPIGKVVSHVLCGKTADDIEIRSNAMGSYSVIIDYFGRDMKSGFRAWLRLLEKLVRKFGYPFVKQILAAKDIPEQMTIALKYNEQSPEATPPN